MFSLAALTKLLGECPEGSSTGEFFFNECIDPVPVCACLSALLVAFHHSTESVAISYANVIMARRDGVLHLSTLPTVVCTALRGAPLSSS